jgi:hypothetical protein
LAHPHPGDIGDCVERARGERAGRDAELAGAQFGAGRLLSSSGEDGEDGEEEREYYIAPKADPMRTGMAAPMWPGGGVPRATGSLGVRR